MDEPTNHLDIWSCEALERSIREFEGTVLVVSHDRYFLNQVADRLIVLGGGKTRVIEGDYETYQRLAQQEAESAAQQSRNATPLPSSTGATPAERSDRRKRKYPYRKSADIEQEIAGVETEVAQIEDRLGQPTTWRDPVKAVELQRRHGELKESLASLYEHWEEAVELNA
jgi:ATP-binding cassette subfamily F protein 3